MFLEIGIGVGPAEDKKQQQRQQQTKDTENRDPLLILTMLIQMEYKNYCTHPTARKHQSLFHHNALSRFRLTSSNSGTSEDIIDFPRTSQQFEFFCSTELTNHLLSEPERAKKSR